MLKIFRSKRNSGLNNFINTVDNKVIAREGDVVGDELLSQIVTAQPDGFDSLSHISETAIIKDLQTVLKQSKYKFFSGSGDFLIHTIGSVKLNSIVFKELEWMTRFDYPYHHTLVITLLVTKLMHDMAGDAEKTREAASCSLTHDFGITRVPEDVLQKTSSLDKDEINMLNEHPTYSYLILTYYFNNFESLNAKVAYEHHENLTGTGYPRGIVQTNLISQLIRICDIFDALMTNRPFRPSLSLNDTLKTIASDVDKGRLNQQAFELLKTYVI
jgi:HD-GYP domain-containing protein (c-di-GMP phosphodiesterase class II)